MSVLTYESDAGVGVITMNRPEKLNALSADLQAEIHRSLTEAKTDDTVRAVVLTGAGRGFCSGADLTSGGGGGEKMPTQAERLDPMGWVGHLATALYSFDKPLIAAMNGVAAGAGMSVSLACDIRVGCENSRFKTVFIERNLSPDTGMSFFLPRIVGYSRAADLIYSSRTVHAEEAHRIGLLDRLVAASELMDTAKELAKQIAKWPPLAMRMSKRVLQQNMDGDLETALRNESTGLSFSGKAVNDRKESIASFLERREPTFTGT